MPDTDFRPLKDRPAPKPGSEAAPTYDAAEIHEDVVVLLQREGLANDRIAAWSGMLIIRTCPHNGEPLVDVPAVPPDTRSREIRGRASATRAYVRTALELERRRAFADPAAELMQQVRALPIDGLAAFAEPHASRCWVDSKGVVIWSPLELIVDGRPAIARRGERARVISEAVGQLIQAFRAEQRRAAALKGTERTGRRDSYSM